ncbi:MAG TPA: DUF4178 domain-containing protein [Blastocatellia bacterium]|nr:DUF4178 domain-containing protein [Blastocatellia bacterium]
MTISQANCPSCGANISFKLGSSIVMICPYCRSVVARTDKSFEDLGKLADLIDTGSPLAVGVRGKYHGQYFELTGRAQMGHQAGGMWDEWYVSFGEGHMGWLAEDQGRFYLTYERPRDASAAIPPIEYLQLGAPVPGLDAKETFIVAERGEARAIAAEGEIPWRLVPGETYLYADIAAEGGKFGTIDYSGPQPIVFLGHEVTLDDLGIKVVPRPERTRTVSAAALSCPHCGGPLALHAPDQSERVVCPNCDSLLDVNQGKLIFFKALSQTRVEPKFPLGSVGKFDNVDYTLVGFMQRSVHFDQDYFWQEYLLYNPQVGFRWLVDSDDHWNFVQTVPPGDVVESAKAATYKGKTFRKYQDAIAKVRYVAGEFYWKVAAGEQVQAVDYIHPPEMLSKEVTRPDSHGHQGTYGEINYSLGTYISLKDVERAFNVTNLPKPTNVAPNQPNPRKGVGLYWLIMTVILLFVAVVSTVAFPSKLITTIPYTFQPLPNADGTQVVFTEKIQLLGNRNIQVSGTAPIDNTWLYAEGDLINEDTGLVQSFSLPIEYYHGVDDGESWSEGSQTKDTYLSSLPAGTYTLRIEAQWEKWQEPASMNVTIKQGGTRGLNLILALSVLLIFPILGWFRKIAFERRRWADSDFSPYGSS